MTEVYTGYIELCAPGCSVTKQPVWQMLYRIHWAVCTWVQMPLTASMTDLYTGYTGLCVHGVTKQLVWHSCIQTTLGCVYLGECIPRCSIVPQSTTSKFTYNYFSQHFTTLYSHVVSGEVTVECPTLTHSLTLCQIIIFLGEIKSQWLKQTMLHTRCHKMQWKCMSVCGCVAGCNKGEVGV